MEKKVKKGGVWEQTCLLLHLGFCSHTSTSNTCNVQNCPLVHIKVDIPIYLRRTLHLEGVKLNQGALHHWLHQQGPESVKLNQGALHHRQLLKQLKLNLRALHWMRKSFFSLETYYT